MFTCTDFCNSVFFFEVLQFCLLISCRPPPPWVEFMWLLLTHWREMGLCLNRIITISPGAYHVTGHVSNFSWSRFFAEHHLQLCIFLQNAVLALLAFIFLMLTWGMLSVISWKHFVCVLGEERWPGWTEACLDETDCFLGGWGVELCVRSPLKLGGWPLPSRLTPQHTKSQWGHSDPPVWPESSVNDKPLQTQWRGSLLVYLAKL